MSYVHTYVCVYIYIPDVYICVYVLYIFQMSHSIDSKIKESNEHGKSTFDFKALIRSLKNNPCIILLVYCKHFLILSLFFHVYFYTLIRFNSKRRIHTKIMEALRMDAYHNLPCKATNSPTFCRGLVPSIYQ